MVRMRLSPLGLSRFETQDLPLTNPRALVLDHLLCLVVLFVFLPLVLDHALRRVQVPLVGVLRKGVRTLQ